MLQSIWDDVRREFSFGNMINRIIIVNVAVFILIKLVWVGFQITSGWPSSGTTGFTRFFRFFCMSEDWWHVLTHPWVVFTHMFLHEGFFHLLWNMLILFWFGRIFGDLLGDRRVLPLYLAGGLAGALAYFLTMNLAPFGHGFAWGASAAVTCILTAAGLFAPEYGIRLLFFGTVRLKWIVFFVIVVQVISLGTSDNFGGTIAHLGGIVFGFLYVFYLRRGTNLTAPVEKSIDWIQDTWHGLQTPSQDHTRSGPRAAYRGGRPVQDTKTKERPSFMRKAGGKGKPANKNKDDDKPSLSHQEQLDAILDKIKERGYNSLTKEEKDFLFRASNK